MHHILVVDDDPINAKMLKFLLQDEGYAVTTTASPRQALEKIDKEHVDLVVLDVILQEMSGLELCRLIRERINAPIIFLSALDTVKDKINGLEAGGDDYVVKPYEPAEFIARIWALLRRSTQLANCQSNLRNADLELDPTTNQVTLMRTGETVRLTPVETLLLRVLISQPGRTLTRDALVIKVWGYQYDTRSNQLPVYISRLRTKLEVDPSKPRLIKTLRAIGYRFQPSTSSPSARIKQQEPEGHSRILSHTDSYMASSVKEDHAYISDVLQPREVGSSTRKN
jgi:DNA-binding response OmpR family regulator